MTFIQIRERLEKATPGPWWYKKNPMRDDGWFAYGSDNKTVSSAQISEADAQFIAHAPEDIAFLLSLCDSLAKECAALRSVLSEWDQDKSCFVQMIEANRIRDERERKG